MSVAPRTPPKKRDWSWRSQAFRGLLYQVIAVVIIGSVVWWLASNTAENMRIRGIKSGFDFLAQPAGFDIGESLFAFDSNNPYWKAFLVGIGNTLRVAIIGIILTTILGTLVGVGRFSRNGLVRGICYGYVELFRNVPVLLQLLMWYLIFTELLPDIADAKNIGAVFLSKGGLTYPSPVWESGHLWIVGGMIAGGAATWFYRGWARKQFEATGKLRSMFWIPLALVVIGGVAGWVAGGMPNEWQMPKKANLRSRAARHSRLNFWRCCLVLCCIRRHSSLKLSARAFNRCRAVNRRRRKPSVSRRDKRCKRCFCHRHFASSFRR
jgi:general L-amino acid transport system permease protein